MTKEQAKYAWVGIFFVILVAVIAYSKLRYKDSPDQPLPEGITFPSHSSFEPPAVPKK